MDLVDRLLGHDEWSTDQMLGLCAGLTDEQFDREFPIGRGTLRETFDHIIHNIEVWTLLMAHQEPRRGTDRSIEGMRARLRESYALLRRVAREIAKRDGWDETWLDTIETPPRETAYGTSIAHVITHSMHHRAQVLNMLRHLGVAPLPEGDVFSWENSLARKQGE